MRGDVGLVLELALAVASFAYDRNVVGSSVNNALSFALSMVSLNYLSLAVATICWRLSPFHPLARFPG